jgi:hypothetical protein
MTPVRRIEYVIGLAIGALFLAPLLVWGGFDTEETALGIFSSQVHYQHLFRGEWLFWLTDLGFGTPMPIGHRLDAHPVFAVSGVTSLRTALSLLWIVQLTAAVVYFLRLSALGGLRPPLRMLLLACYVFSVVSVCWFYENDWVTFVVAWTTLPMLLFYLREVVVGEGSSNRWTRLVRLALAFGFVILNSHPGYVAPIFTSLAIYAVVAAPRQVAVWAGLFAAFVLTVAMTGERLYYFATEALFFPSFERYSQPEYQLGEYARALVAPFSPVDGNMRLPFIGVGLALAALGSVVRRRQGDPHLRACAVTFLAALVLSLIPPHLFSLYTAASGSWLFRDPMFFFALLAGGHVLQHGLDHPRTGVRRLAAALLVVQVCQQAATIWPGALYYYDRRDSAMFYRQLDEPVDLVRALERHAGTFGRRLYLSPQVQVLTRGALARYGVRVGTDLTLRGFNPINGWFKVVSMDRLYPSIYFMHGYIRGERDVVENRSLLDVLGVGLVLTTEGEGPVPDGLSVLERIPVDTSSGPHVLLLLGNPDSWPQAALLSTDARSLGLPQRAGCPNDRALCRDFTRLAESRVAPVSSVTGSNGRYSVRVPPADAERVLFLSTTYRPEWRAVSSGSELRVDPVAEAFLGITVPAGVREVDLAFVPTWRIRLTWLSGLTALSMVLFLCVTAWRRR